MYTVGVFFWGAMINHNVGIGDCSITWDVADVSVQKKKDSVHAFGDASTSLHQAIKFFAYCLEPQISEQGIFDHLLVMGDGFFGDGVYYSVAVFFYFNDRACILIVNKCARDGYGRCISKSRVNDVIQCLALDIAGHPVADETGGAAGLAEGSCGWCTIPFVTSSTMGRAWVCCLV